MIEHRPFSELGRFDNDWLAARYHFSFSGYRDPERMSWGALRVWNDDTVQPHTGFSPHGHENMEIITYIRSGAISHRDSLGNEGRTAAGDVQVMSAGSGIQHAEMNREDEATTLFQIWIMPAERAGKPYWQTKPFPKAERTGAFDVLASGYAEDTDALPIRQTARVLGARLLAGQTAEWRFAPERFGYLVLAAGAADVNGVALNARDGAAIKDEEIIRVTAATDCEIVMVDAPPHP